MVELNTLSPKKWVANYSGNRPTIDLSNGVRNGDFAIDTSTTPNRIWICEVNTTGSPIWMPYDRSNVTPIITTYTASVYDRIILANAFSSAFTVTLPAVSGNSGVELYIKKIDSSLNVVSVDGNALERIDGELIQNVNSQYDTMAIVCDGTGWMII